MYTTPNKDGMQPLPNEKGVRAFLQQLKVSKYGDPVGNDAAFQAKDVKTFDRPKNRYGHPYADFNNQKSTQTPLANPRLNVQTEAFRAVDSVGQGMRHQWKVLNRLTNEYVTHRMLNKEDAIEMASNLNKEFLRTLTELNVPQVQHRQLPATPLQEGLFVHDQARMNSYVAAIERTNHPMSYSVGATPRTGAIHDLKQTALLVEMRKARFGEDTFNSDELSAIHSVSRHRR
jgi:hypothetical protein